MLRRFTVLATLAFLTLLTMPGWDAPLSAQKLLPDPTPNQTVDPALYAGLDFRFAGPYRGGRVTAVAGYPDRPHTFLMGSTGGGVWKTENAGQTWRNITDGQIHTAPIGAIAIAPSAPEVIYVGSGSGGTRGNISVGDGMYRSTDAGETWTWIGLPESEHINRIMVHPRNEDVVYVAALGHIFGPNPERGVYRTLDGGETWELVLFVSERTGAIDLVMHPENPRILYAAMWEAERKPWTMRSGGDEGGVFMSRDGGDTWVQLENGLPPDPVGRIGLAISAADPDRVYALVEAQEHNRGLYRSDDGGRSWSFVSKDRNLMARPWYYMHVDAHPTDPNTVFVNNEGFFRSVDAGATWTPIATPHGDNHDLWINPEHPNIWIQSNDGGANVTLDNGESWSSIYNQPTAELYTVTVDNGFPYRLYAPQQDNSTFTIPSRVERALHGYVDFVGTAGCETGPVTPHPEDPMLVFGGCKGEVSLHDRRNNQIRQVWLYPQEPHALANSELKYREQWNSQIRFSPHDPTKVYHTSEFVHVTRNWGQTWEIISPDLTRWDEHSHLHEGPPGGPLTYDQTGVEVYGTVFALEESPLQQGLIWAGSDDGKVSITRDDGANWTDITPPGMELHTTVNEIVLSAHDAGRAFVVGHRYRMDDFRPLVWRTDDFGESWTFLTDGSNGIPSDWPTRAVMEDPTQRGLLYAGTEFGLFVSFDDGAHWQPFQQNLPATPVTDLVIHEGDLIVSTQGRGLWILDDVTPMAEVAAGLADIEPGHLFEPRAAYRMRLAWSGENNNVGRGGPYPDNPPEGAILHYRVSDPSAAVRIEVTDAGGQPVKSWGTTPSEQDEPQALQPHHGTNRFVWDLRHPAARLAPGVSEGYRDRIAPVTGFTGGPRAVPGAYTVTLRVGDWSQSRTLEVRKDPRLESSIADLQANFDLHRRVVARIDAIQDGIATSRVLVDEIGTVEENVPDESILAKAAEVKGKTEGVASRFFKYELEGDHAHLRPQLTTDYARIGTILESADYRPTDTSFEQFDVLQGTFDGLMEELRVIIDVDVAELNRMLNEAGFEGILVPRRKPIT